MAVRWTKEAANRLADLYPWTSVSDAENPKRAFIQDYTKARPNLLLIWAFTMSISVYSTKADGRALPFDFATRGGFCPPNASFYFATHGGFDPLVGLAWSPGALHGKTVIRSGYSICHEGGTTG